MTDQSFKQGYSFLMLLATIGWAVFLVKMIERAIDKADAGTIVTAAGVGILLGSLVTWEGMIVTHWFRRAKPE